MIHSSPLPPVDVPEMALTPFVLRKALERGDRAAFIDGRTGRTITYAQLDEMVRRVSGGLVAAGFEVGDVVAMMAPNQPDYGVVFHAVALAGGVVTTVNPSYSPDEVRHQLNDSGATWMVTVTALVGGATEARSGTAVHTLFVLDGDGGSDGGAEPIGALVGVLSAGQAPVDLDDVVALPYSSGTTGLSKGVMLTHRNLVANLVQSQAVLEIGEEESFVAVLPFFHIYGMQVLMNLGLMAGATIVTLPRFDLREFLSLHEEHGLTRAFVAPPIVLALARDPAVGDYDLSALRIVLSGAASLSIEVAQEASARIGCDVAQGYGMTELSPITHVTRQGDVVPGSVGVTVPNTELRIVDTTGRDAGPGADGELWIRGPQVMQGYLGNPEATAATIDPEGWLHTGDAGHIDETGHLFLVDRLKELIKYKGFQVAPAELEALLLTHPAVADAAVVGVPDETAGEVPVAHVVVADGATATDEEIRAHVAARVAPYKQVRQVVFAAAIPKSPSGKILRRLLRTDPVGEGPSTLATEPLPR